MLLDNLVNCNTCLGKPDKINRLFSFQKTELKWHGKTEDWVTSLYMYTVGNSVSHLSWGFDRFAQSKDDKDECCKIAKHNLPSDRPKFLQTWAVCWSYHTTSVKQRENMVIRQCLYNRCIQFSHNERTRTFWHVRPTKTQIRLRMRAVWSESSLDAWRNFAWLAIENELSEDSDQTARIPNVIWIFAGCTWSKVRFLTCGATACVYSSFFLYIYTAIIY